MGLDIIKQAFFHVSEYLPHAKIIRLEYNKGICKCIAWDKKHDIYHEVKVRTHLDRFICKKEQLNNKEVVSDN